MLDLYHRRFGNRNFRNVLVWLRNAGIAFKLPAAAKPPALLLYLHPG